MRDRRPAEEYDAAFTYEHAGPAERERHPQNAVGKTVARVVEWGFVSEIYFTDGTKLRLIPDLTEEVVEIVYHDDPAAD